MAGNEISKLFVVIGAKTEDFVKGMDSVEKQMKVVGAAITAVGAAGLKLSDDARKMNAELGQTGLTIGKSTGEMRELALATTDVTFPLDSVAKTFELLAKSGVTGTDEMQKAAKAFDALADATGSSADTVADLLLPAFKLFGEEIPQTSEELDKFTWLTKNTLVDLGDFGTLLTRMAPYMDDLNLSMDDAIAILAALSEQGIVGTAATLKLRTAITEAAREGTELTEVLGITQEEIDGYKEKMEGATGITDKYAEVANTQFGTMDKLKQKWSELTLQAGSFLTPLEPILAGMTAMGPVLMTLSSGMGMKAIATAGATAALIAHKVAMLAGIIATKAAAVAQWALNAAMSANPIGLIILAIAALVAGIIWMVKHWDTVKEKLGVVWEWMKVTFGKVVDFFKEALEKILQFFLAPIIVIKEGWDEFIGWVKEVPGKIQGFFEGIGDKISGHFSGLKEKVGSHFQQTGEQVVYLMNAMGVDTNQLAQNMVKNYEAAGGGIKGVFTAQMGAMKDVVSGIMDKLGIDTSQILQNMLQFFVSIGTNIGQAALNIWTSIQNTFKNAWNTAMEWGKNVVQGLWAGIQSLAGWIWGKVMEFAKGIFDSIKRGLGALWPFSPSEAGVDIGEGLLLGIRKGIMDSLRLLNDMDLLINPRLAGVGMGAMGSLGHAGAGDTYGDTVITGNQFVIREDADIERIAVALERRRRARHV